jgi:hypothetical protein
MTENKNKNFEYYIKKLLGKFEKEKDLASCYLLYVLGYSYEQSNEIISCKSSSSNSLRFRKFSPIVIEDSNIDLLKKFLLALEDSSTSLEDLYILLINLKSLKLDIESLKKRINNDSELETQVFHIIELSCFIISKDEKTLKEKFSQLSVTDNNLKLCEKLFELILYSEVDIDNLDKTYISTEFLGYYATKASTPLSEAYDILKQSLNTLQSLSFDKRVIDYSKRRAQNICISKRKQEEEQKMRSEFSF